MHFMHHRNVKNYCQNFVIQTLTRYSLFGWKYHILFGTVPGPTVDRVSAWRVLRVYILVSQDRSPSRQS